MARRVVCGFELVIATFSPTSAFVSVDLPTFGRPTNETKPAWKPSAPEGAAAVVASPAVSPVVGASVMVWSPPPTPPAPR